MADYPFLGAQYHKDKTVFRVQSEHAAGMELCLFSPDEKEEIRIKMNKGDDNVWTAEVPAVKPGQKYGYRAYGEYDPSRGLFFNPAKLAVDPYGFEVSKTMDEWTSPLLDIENSHDSAPVMPKSVVVDMKRIFDPEKYPHLQKRPSFPIAKDIIYETHIKNFSHLNTMLPREKRGKLSGLGDSWTLNYFKRLGVNNIELMPIAPTCCGRQIQKREGRTDSWGYNPYCFFAVDPRYGNWEDFAAAVSELHKAGIGVILDWVPAHFPKDAHGLANFDGSCVYEYADPRKGEHPDWGTKVFDYSKNEVANFLIANGMFWVDKFHIDGLRVDAVASMLYLDYGRTEGNWVPNKYGDNGNLEAISFLKHFNSMLKKRFPQAITIAEESTAWPMVSGDPDNGECLGFTFKWNMGWMHDFLEYMKLDPYFRKFNHSKMTFSLMYAYSENFILVLSHDEVVHLKCSMLGKMPGDREDKFKNLKLAYAYMCGHPGKKLLFMGQEFGQWNEWSEKRALDWYLLEDESHTELKDFTKKCLKLNKNYPCLYATDYSSEGFRWINANDKDNSVLSFMRISPDGKKNLLFVLNFTPVERDSFRIGVPFKTKYKLVLGDNEADQKKTLTAVKGDCDGYPQSLLIDLHKYGIAVYEFNGDVSKVHATKI